MLYYDGMEPNVVQGAFRPRRWWQTWRFALAVLVVVLIIVGGVVYAHVEHDRNVKKQNEAAQKSLFAELSQSTLAQNGDNTTISLATQLIAGQNAKKYTLSSTDLGQVYLDRATSYTNLGKLQQALNDYRTAVKVDSALQIGALQGELTVQSRLGNKSALLPILKQLVTLLQHSEMPLASDQELQYQDDITAIQNGQEVSF